MKIVFINKKFKLAFSIILAMAMIIVVLFYIKDYRQYSTDLHSLQQRIISGYKSSFGYNVSLSQSNVKIEGKLNPEGSFVGKIHSGDSALGDVIQKDAKVYIKEAGSEKWSGDNKNYLAEINMISHPEYIQLQKRLRDVYRDNKTYLHYEILFEKPNQEVVKLIPPSQLEELRIYGDVLIEKTSLKLYEINLHYGKKGKNTMTIHYTPLVDLPQIKIPEL